MASQSLNNKKSINRYKRWRKDVQGNLYRLSLHPFLLDDDTRYAYLLNLSAFGDDSDIEHLESICKSNKEPSNIKDAAKRVIEEIKKNNH